MKEWHLISNNVKQAHDIEVRRWYGDFKGALKLSCMVSRTLVYHVTVAAYISGVVTIIIATTHFLFFWQSRIAPIKSQSIPHLELQATLLLAKSMKNIYEISIPIIPVNLLSYWSDSTIALSWIKNTSKNMNYIMIVAFQKFANFLTH